MMEGMASKASKIRKVSKVGQSYKDSHKDYEIPKVNISEEAALKDQEIRPHA